MTVFEQVQQIVPSLRSTLGGEPPRGALCLGDTSALQALCAHWAAAHPEAGVHYQALRCWGLAIWQPIYLSVIAAHLGPGVPRLAGLAQPVVEGFPRGVHLPEHELAVGGFAQRREVAVAELRALCDATRAALRPMLALHARAADRLQAECVLGALLLLRRHVTTLCNEHVVDAGTDWLARLGLSGGCGFFGYRVRDGTTALALDRQVCCHHFRRRDGERCSTCPKLPLDTRIARLLAEAP